MKENELKIRFIRDKKLPIDVFEEPYWSFYLDLYEKEFSSKTMWNKLVEEVGDGVEKFLDDFYTRRDIIIKDLHEKIDSKFNNNSKDFSKDNILSSYYDIDIELEDIKRTDVYLLENIGKTFISIDLRKANFEAINLYDNSIFTGENITTSIDEIYEKWISKFNIEGEETLNEYIKTSKYFREVVFGNINPSRTIRIEKWIIAGISKFVRDYLGSNGRLIQLGSDEVVFELSKRIN